jgi:hypothetical protein
MLADFVEEGVMRPSSTNSRASDNAVLGFRSLSLTCDLTRPQRVHLEPSRKHLPPADGLPEQLDSK